MKLLLESPITWVIALAIVVYVIAWWDENRFSRSRKYRIPLSVRLSQKFPYIQCRKAVNDNKRGSRTRWGHL